MKETRKITPVYKVSYSKDNQDDYYEYPTIVLSGKWITKKYGWKIGETVKIKYGKNYIKIYKEGGEKNEQ